LAVNYTANEAAAKWCERSAQPAARRSRSRGDVADEAQVLELFAQVDARLGRLTARW
jgi:hypothetical protein